MHIDYLSNIDSTWIKYTHINFKLTQVVGVCRLGRLQVKGRENQIRMSTPLGAHPTTIIIGSAMTSPPAKQRMIQPSNQNLLHVATHSPPDWCSCTLPSPLWSPLSILIIITKTPIQPPAPLFLLPKQTSILKILISQTRFKGFWTLKPENQINWFLKVAVIS